MVLDLETEILSLKQGDHLCLIYESDPLEQLPVLLPYMKQGLENGERCVYVADDLTLDQLRKSLLTFGIEVDAEMSRGALCLWTREEWRQPGELVSAKKALQVREVIEEALALGFSGIRFAVEMTWTLGPDIAEGPLRHWEATINTIFQPDVPARIVCQYSRSRLPAEVIIAGLSTHPLAVIGADVIDNHYFEGPLVLQVDETAAAPGISRADWMISQLQLAKAASKEREERIKAEAALREAEASRKRIEELLRLAQSTAEDLRRANRAKDEFLALISHELRTPVTTILGNAEILRSREDSLDRDSREQALKDLHKDAKRLSSLIGNLLLLTRLESGKAIDGEPVLIDRVVRQVAAEHRAQHPHRNVRCAPSAVNTIALAQTTYVEDVLRNLLSNAEKYSPLEEPIDIAVTRLDHQVQVSVLDRGIGLDEEEAKSVFTAFYRSPRIARQIGGMGIGLAVCHRLVEALGGTIWAKPRDNGPGSEFTFALRLVEDA